jgi:(p)ppGpp synthase/HD superfamily hydrolase
MNHTATDKEILAGQLANLAHKEQLYNTGPYIEHPKRVVYRLWDMGIDDSDCFIVAWLHDVIEDTSYLTLDKVEEYFGKRVRDAVDAISRRRGPEYPAGKEPEWVYLDRVRVNEVARLVKLADMNDNLMMTASPTCSPEKQKLWRKYLNAVAYLSDSVRPFEVEFLPLLTVAELAEQIADSYFDEDYD